MGVGVAIPVTVITFGPLSLLAIMKSIAGVGVAKTRAMGQLHCFQGAYPNNPKLMLQGRKNETSRPYNTKNPYYVRNGLGGSEGTYPHDVLLINPLL